jgi:hypothetical protein
MDVNRACVPTLGTHLSAPALTLRKRKFSVARDWFERANIARRMPIAVGTRRLSSERAMQPRFRRASPMDSAA